MRGAARSGDAEIRQLLLRHLNAPTATVIEELGLCQGECRLDVAVVNTDTLHGYEIKSERDTLRRLERQQAIYNQVLDRVTLVISPKHAKAAQERIPTWWGLWVVKPAERRLSIQVEREAGENPHIVPDALVQLLWREEALTHLKALNQHRGVCSKPRRVIWHRLANALSLDELRAIIRARLRARVRTRHG